jgi:hypothetical protein
LLSSAVNNLLAHENDLVLFDSTGQEEDLTDHIKHFEPDVIITDGRVLRDMKVNLFELSGVGCELKVIIINMEQNLVNSLKYQEIPITQSHDFVQALHS